MDCRLHILIAKGIASLFLTTNMALAISLAKPGCQEKCGNVTIPYPFGISSKCSANSWFQVDCKNSSITFLTRINMEALSIDLITSRLRVRLPVSPMNCSDPLNETTQYLGTSLRGSPFIISSDENIMTVLGCQNSVWWSDGETAKNVRCKGTCDANSTDTSCNGNGVNCCQSRLPEQLQEFQYTYQRGDEATNNISRNSLCGYAFPVEWDWFENGYRSYKGLLSHPANPYDQDFVYVPLVLVWELELHYSDGLSSFSSCFGSSRHCSCQEGFEGNPYFPGGCSDIDECNSTRKYCINGTCVNYYGSYGCYRHQNDSKKIPTKIIIISIASGLGALISLLGAWRCFIAIRKRIEANRKHKFFKRNGGLLWEQQLSSTNNGVNLEKTMLFGSKELAQATDQFNENRIIGRGGQGTVYKGMLRDGRIIAVKKSKRVDERDLQVFINEVVILSQINHRNIVKLLGCCLETEVPLLVYEFVPNGTLFQHIHDPAEELPLSWEMRLRIAKEVAGALSYLHSSASTPIYHRDIKSTNILLDEKYRAKVADFGTSRSISIDQTHLTTKVLGTFGYLDPEYFQSSQFTEKSDVYSFGVVMVELLTGEKAVSTIRAEEGRGLAAHFLRSMDEDRLFGILDPKVVEEGRREEIVGIAELARRCLHMNGKRRPVMKEVSVELEGIRMVIEEGQNGENSMGESSAIEIAEPEDDDFSSTSGSMNSGTFTFTKYDHEV